MIFPLFSLLHALLFAQLVHASGRWVTDPRRGPEKHRLNDDNVCSLPYKLARGGPAQMVWVNVTGQMRYFHVHLPKNYVQDQPTPVYFDFHGGRKDATEEQNLTSLADANINPHGIAVFPQGLRYPKSNTSYRYWLSNPNVDSSATPNDLDYVSSILDCLNLRLTIDNTRIYAMGKSNGGGFVHTLACNASVGGRFAAFASVSGAYYDTATSPGIGPCTPFLNSSGKPSGIINTPFLEFHGLDDCIAPYDGRPVSHKCPHAWCRQIGVPGFLATWLKLNGCSVPAKPGQKTTVVPEKFEGDVEVETYTCDPSRGPVLKHYRQKRIGHAWPSTFKNDDCCKIKCPKSTGGGDQCRKVPYWYNATERILNFWDGYRWPESRMGGKAAGAGVGADKEAAEKGEGGYGWQHEEL